MRVYYAAGGISIYHGDCRTILPSLSADVIIADPPYGETSLVWDEQVRGWTSHIVPREMGGPLALWCFGSLRMLVSVFAMLQKDGWQFAQDLVWRKHNGSIFHADRFRRVHELVAQFYRGPWGDVWKQPLYTNDATARTVRAKARPPHTGHIERIPYVSVDGGPRLMQSVLEVRSCHGDADHPTQKPLGIIRPLIEYSSPAGGMVVDPFMGSGSTLVAAKELGRRAVGIEIEERFCEIAARRLAQEALTFA